MLRLLAVAISLLLGMHSALAEDAAPIRLDAGTDPATYCSRVQAAFTRGDFAALEITAQRARSLENRFPGGKAELQIFYESFYKQSCNGNYSPLTEDGAKARAAIAERWLGENPNSMTAKITNAMIWYSSAWAARGSGFANEVSSSQWAVFADRIKQAAQFMRNVDPDRDAQAYLVLLNLARDLRVPRPQIDTIFRRAHERFPSYLEYYADYATILLPKWFGAPGDISDYVRSLLDDPGGDLGAMAYSRAAERIAWESGSPSGYRDAGLTWENVRRGFALRESRDGLNKPGWITLCYYAYMAGDREAAREAFRHITHIDEWPHGDTGDFFRTVLPWIMERD